MAATAVTLNDLDCHSLVAGLFKCNRSNICAAFYTISTDSVLALFHCARFFTNEYLLTGCSTTADLNYSMVS